MKAGSLVLLLLSELAEVGVRNYSRNFESESVTYQSFNQTCLCSPPTSLTFTLIIGLLLGLSPAGPAESSSLIFEPETTRWRHCHRASQASRALCGTLMTMYTMRGCWNWRWMSPAGISWPRTMTCMLKTGHAKGLMVPSLSRSRAMILGTSLGSVSLCTGFPPTPRMTSSRSMWNKLCKSLEGPVCPRMHGGHNMSPTWEGGLKPLNTLAASSHPHGFEERMVDEWTCGWASKGRGRC